MSTFSSGNNACGGIFPKNGYNVVILSICEYLPEQSDIFRMFYCEALATFAGVFGFNVRTLNVQDDILIRCCCSR